MNASLDKGSIIAQQFVGACGKGATLASSYEELDRAAKRLFMDAFVWYGFWESMKKEPQGTGSYHSVKDGSFAKELIDTYDIQAADFKKT